MGPELGKLGLIQTQKTHLTRFVAYISYVELTIGLVGNDMADIVSD